MGDINNNPYLKEYDEIMTNIKETFDSFIKNAEEGRNGVGSKVKALEARKKSSKLGELIKSGKENGTLLKQGQTQTYLNGRTTLSDIGINYKDSVSSQTICVRSATFNR